MRQSRWAAPQWPCLPRRRPWMARRMWSLRPRAVDLAGAVMHGATAVPWGGRQAMARGQVMVRRPMVTDCRPTATVRRRRRMVMATVRRRRAAGGAPTHGAVPCECAVKALSVRKMRSVPVLARLRRTAVARARHALSPFDRDHGASECACKRKTVRAPARNVWPAFLMAGSRQNPPKLDQGGMVRGGVVRWCGSRACSRRNGFMTGLRRRGPRRAPTPRGRRRMTAAAFPAYPRAGREDA